MGSTRPVTHLIDLPSELLIEVLSHLRAIRSFEPQSQAFKYPRIECARQRENDRRRKGLHGLSLACRRLNHISEPVLYSCLLSTATWNGVHQLQLYMDAITIYPGRLQYVSYIENRLCDYLGNALNDDAELYGAVDVVSKYFANLAYIIARSSNLIHLSVVSIESSDVSLWDHLVLSCITHNSPKSVGSCFSKLQTLCVQMQSADCGIRNGPGWFRPLVDALTLVPTLENLLTSGVTMSDPLAPMPGRLNNLQVLSLTECILDIAEVTNLLSACNALKQFSCQWAFLRTCKKFLCDLESALYTHKDTLEAILLDMREVRFYSNDPMEEHASSLDFQDFVALKRLDICETCIRQAPIHVLEVSGQSLRQPLSNILPSSVQQFALLLGQEWVANDLHGGERHLDHVYVLQELAENARNNLLHLREVCIKSALELSAPLLTRSFEAVDIDFFVIQEASLLV